MKYKRFLQQLSFSFLKLCAYVPLCLCASLHNFKKLCAYVPLCLCASLHNLKKLCAFVPLCLCASLHGAKRREGFTLIELMLVVVIIGVLLAVIVPRAWRANIDTKYATLRQTCVQLSGFANDWAERQLETQAIDDAAVLADYMNSLAGVTSGNPTSGGPHWIADEDDSNWNNNDGPLDVDERAADVSASVQDLVPTDPPLRNPFTGLEVFQSGNDDGAPGAIACAYQRDDGQNYYALIFQSASDTGEYYAGMGDSDLAGLRNGIFINKLMPR